MYRDIRGARGARLKFDPKTSRESRSKFVPRVYLYCRPVIIGLRGCKKSGDVRGHKGYRLYIYIYTHVYVYVRTCTAKSHKRARKRCRVKDFSEVPNVFGKRSSIVCRCTRDKRDRNENGIKGRGVRGPTRRWEGVYEPNRLSRRTAPTRKNVP